MIHDHLLRIPDAMYGLEDQPQMQTAFKKSDFKQCLIRLGTKNTKNETPKEIQEIPFVPIFVEKSAVSLFLSSK